MKALTWFACVALVCRISNAEAETLAATFNSASDVPVTTTHGTARGKAVHFTLNFAPATGTTLTVVKQVGLPFIDGTFDNLADGQLVTLNHGGSNYQFVADYHGGKGNDLVLQWARTRVFAWGYNACGQLGDNITNSSLIPLTVNHSADSALHDKIPVAISAGDHWSLALCSDGTLAAWGVNDEGQVGDGTTIDRRVPTAQRFSAFGNRWQKSGGHFHRLAARIGTMCGWLRGELGL